MCSGYMLVGLPVCVRIWKETSIWLSIEFENYILGRANFGEESATQKITRTLYSQGVFYYGY